MSQQEFASRISWLLDEIGTICDKVGRNPAEVEILPVTKTHPAVVVDWVRQAGLRAVGENRVQETLEKQASGRRGVEWELIGHLQTNKARVALDHFDRIQSVDRIKLVRILGRIGAETERTVRILLQVNAGRDTAKFGCAPEETEALLESVLREPCLRLEGLMTIAPLAPDPAVARSTFAALRTIRERLQDLYKIPLPVLSMGMTSDMVEAIAEGSTQVRIGTALFGERA